MFRYPPPPSVQQSFRHSDTRPGRAKQCELFYRLIPVYFSIQNLLNETEYFFFWLQNKVIFTVFAVLIREVKLATPFTQAHILLLYTAL